MARSHPPTLIKIVQRTLSEEIRLERGQGVLVALSGGSDSTALVHVLAVLRDKLHLELRAHAIDHGIRPEASREVELARELTRRLSIAFGSTKLSLEPGSNLQARARSARYQALREAMKRHAMSYIATAHHADDRAETVLLRLLRGSGPRGLAVLPARNGDLIRPMIRAKKIDVTRHIKRHALAFAEDPSNQDARFMRVRVRQELLPLLSELSPGIVDHLNALADQLFAGARPKILDSDGVEVDLGRAQLGEILRAQRLGRSHVRLLLHGSEEMVVETPPKRGASSASRRRSAAVKPTS